LDGAELAMESETPTPEPVGRRRLITYAAIFGLIAAAIPILVGSVNYFVDISDIFQHGTRSSDAVVAAFVEAARKAEIGVELPEEDRPVKLQLGRSSTADCLMVGSSHVMMFRQDNNPVIAADCRSMDNLALISASYEDVLTMLGVAAMNPNTRHVFIGIDAFTFQRQMHKKWQKNLGAFLAAREAFGLSPEVYARVNSVPLDSGLSPLFSFRYFNNNLKALKRAMKSGEKDFDMRPLTDADLPEITVMRGDGSIGLHNEFKPTPDDAELGTGAARIKKPFIDPGTYEEMRQSLAKLREMGKDVTIVLTPLHPKVVACASPLVCECLKTVEPAVRELALAVHADVIGSYDPARFGLERADFVDDQHLRTRSVHKLTVTLSIAR
jgi:hypothetical protein